jgi:hypothetical protein
VRQPHEFGFPSGPLAKSCSPQYRGENMPEQSPRSGDYPDAFLHWTDWERVVTCPWGAGENWFMEMFPGPFRHLASEVLSDLVTAVLVALAAVIASRLLDRIWDAL